MTSGGTMDRTIVDMIEFMDTGTSSAPDVLGATHAIGAVRFRVVASKVLAWLKYQHTLAIPRPLVLNDNYEWCTDLVNLATRHAFLRNVIEVRGRDVVLTSGLTEADRKELLAFVDSRYQPRLMT